MESVYSFINDCFFVPKFLKNSSLKYHNTTRIYLSIDCPISVFPGTFLYCICGYFSVLLIRLST